MNKNPRRTGAKAFLTAALLATASAACALGLGKPPTALTLGDYLDVSIPLRLEPGEDVPDSCITSDIYFGEDKLGVGMSRARIETAPNGERVIRILANARISEPVVSIYVAAGCTSRVSRKFVVFADPPLDQAVVAQAPAADAPDLRVSAPPPALPPAPVRAPRAADRATQAAASGDVPASAPDKGRSRAARRAAQPAPAVPGLDTRVATLDADAAAPKARSGKKKDVRKPAATGGGARLQLDPIESAADVVVDPQLRMTLDLPALPGGADAQPSAEQLARRATAAAMWRALNASPEEQARDQQRLKELETRLAQLQREGDAARKQVQDLQARVTQAEAHRTGNGVMLGLAGLCAALAAALSWLIWKRREDAQGSWWSASRVDSAQSEAPGPSLLTEAPPEAAVVPPAPPPAPAAPPTAKPPVRPSVELPVLKKVVSAPAAKPPAAAVRPARAPVPDRQVSVEELIDLEQQAEFFLVLGQDQSAIDLLESHIDSTAGTSPLPYLKLLELFRKRDERDQYEAIRERFNGRFNAYAPEWESDLQQGHVLADYPGVVERLQGLWSTPERAMDVLQASLLKREPGDETFDLPAYRELLMLYSVARDLAERQDGAAAAAKAAPAAEAPVDLLLPIGGVGGAGGAAGAGGEPVERLTATRPVKAYPQAHRPLEVDVDLPDIGAPAEQPRPSVPVDVSLDEPAAAEPAPAASSRSMEFEPVEAPGPGSIRRGGGPAGGA